MDLTIQILSVAGISSLVATFVSGYIRSSINKNEREFFLEKEEYYKLQIKAEIIFGHMSHYDDVVQEICGQLEVHIMQPSELTKNKEEFEKSKCKIYKVMHVYFWDISSQYNDYLEAVTKLMDIYFDVASNQDFSQKDIDKINLLLPEFREKQFKFTTSILDLIESKRNHLRG